MTLHYWVLPIPRPLRRPRWQVGRQNLALPPNTAGQLIISEFRLRGPFGANDEFIELYNTTGAALTVTSLSGTGLGVAASDGLTVAQFQMAL